MNRFQKIVDKFSNNVFGVCLFNKDPNYFLDKGVDFPTSDKIFENDVGYEKWLRASQVIVDSGIAGRCQEPLSDLTNAVQKIYRFSTARENIRREEVKTGYVDSVTLSRKEIIALHNSEQILSEIAYNVLEAQADQEASDNKSFNMIKNNNVEIYHDLFDSNQIEPNETKVENLEEFVRDINSKLYQYKHSNFIHVLAHVENVTGRKVTGVEGDADNMPYEGFGNPAFKNRTNKNSLILSS